MVDVLRLRHEIDKLSPPVRPVCVSVMPSGVVVLHSSSSGPSPSGFFFPLMASRGQLYGVRPGQESANNAYFSNMQPDRRKMGRMRIRTLDSNFEILRHISSESMNLSLHKHFKSPLLNCTSKITQKVSAFLNLATT